MTVRKSKTLDGFLIIESFKMAGYGGSEDGLVTRIREGHMDRFITLHVSVIVGTAGESVVHTLEKDVQNCFVTRLSQTAAQNHLLVGRIRTLSKKSFGKSSDILDQIVGP